MKTPVVAIGSRLSRFDWVTTLGLRPNLTDYPPEGLALIRQAEKIYYPTDAFAAQMQAMGKAIFPSLECHLFEGDKIRQNALFDLLDLPRPRTRIFYGRQRENILEHFRFPFIAKTPRRSALGRGIFIVDTPADLAAYLANHKIALIQEKLPISRDVRVVVINFEPVCAYWRVCRPGEFRSNVAQGGLVDFDNVPAGAVDLALKLAKGANLDEVGVDVAWVDGRPLLLEFNVKYGRKGPLMAGIDVVQVVADKIKAGEI